MRKKVNEQLILRQTLVDLVETSQQQQQTSSDNLQSQMDSLKNGMEENSTSFTSLQDQFKEQSDKIESQLEVWGEAGKVFSADLKEIKKKQEEMAAIVGKRVDQISGLYDTIVTPIKTHTHPIF